MPPAVRAAALAWREDLTTLVPGGVRPVAAEGQGSWTTAVAPGFEPGPQTGSRQLLQRLAGNLDEGGRDFIEQAVLKPTRPRDGLHGDHDQAERRFVRHLGQGAGPAADDDLAWRRAVVGHMLPYLLDAGKRSLPDRLAIELASGCCRLERAGTAWCWVHRPGAGADELRRWQLALPLGSILAADNAFHIGGDEHGRLDGEAPLAAGRALRRPPVWRSRQRLCAADLWALEQDWFDQLGETTAGIGSFEIGTSLTAELRDGSLLLTARELKGRTDSGRAVILCDGEELTARLPAAADAELHLEAWIEVVHQAPADEGEEDPPRLRLQAQIVQRDDPPPSRQRYRLHLGRFRWQPGSPLRLAGWPVVQTFAAIRPFDESWEAHVAPLALALDALPLQEARSVAFAVESARLANEWLELPVPVLARRLQRVAMLRCWRPAGGARRRPLPELAWLGTVSGQQLPGALAGLLEPALAPQPREQLLVCNDDYDAIPAGQTLTVRFRRALAAGRLQVRCSAPLPQVPPLMLTGRGIAQPLEPGRNGRAVYSSTLLRIGSGDEFRISPLGHLWRDRLLGELWFVEETP
jgi:hypothetical protein